MRHLTDVFANAKGYKTEKSARQKLAKFSEAIPEDAIVTVAQRADGLWIAVLFVRHTHTVNLPYLAGNGICVTN